MTTEESLEKLLEQTMDTRVQAWSKWGTVSPDVLTHLLNPTFAGGPRWPAMRQGFRTARQDGAVLVASDGLSDPWDDGDEGNGFGLEFFAITSDPLESVAGSWLWDIVWQMSQFAAKHGGIGPLLDEVGHVSTELYAVGIPEDRQADFVNEAGRVGVLLGLTAEPIPPGVEGPLSEIRLVNVKLLTLGELEYVVDRGEAGREELVRRFGLVSANTLVSSLGRPSVI